MKTPRNTNHQIAVRHFWEHAQFGWIYPDRIVDQPKFYAGYLAMVRDFTESSIERMVSVEERQRLRELLFFNHGGLIPNEFELGFPPLPRMNDLGSWSDTFSKLQALYGKAVGRNRRTAKEPQGSSSGLVIWRENLSFVPTQSTVGEGRWILEAEYRNGLVRTTMQEFPREHLYRAEHSGGAVQFDDWPLAWLRLW